MGRATMTALIAGAVLGTVLDGSAQGEREASPGTRAAAGGRGGDLVIGGNLLLPDSDTTRGNILKNGRLFLHDRGSGNLGLGREALASVGPDGVNNVAIGPSALGKTTAGGGNVALGAFPLDGLVDGDGNVAVGQQALGSLTDGSDNIAIGILAGVALVGGRNNIYIGESFSPANESDTIRIGTLGTSATFIRGIFETEVDVDAASAVSVGSDGRLGRIVAVSSGRFKTDVRTVDPEGDVLGRLRPVTFRYRPGHGDGGQTLRYGLIAEEVAEIAPELVRLDGESRPLAVRYEAVPILLLAEAQRQRARMDAERADLQAQRRELEAQAREIQAQRQALEALQARLAGLEAVVRGSPAP